MGPRRLSPWKTENWQNIDRSRQCCFNGATAMSAVEDGQTAAATSSPTRLQWGHGDCAVEDVEPRQRTAPTAASMGPRRLRPWKTRFTVSDVRRSPASMGPRRLRRGRSAVRDCARMDTSRFNGATAIAPWKTHFESVAVGAMRRFNGATAIAAVEDEPVDVLPAPIDASMGPRRLRPWKTDREALPHRRRNDELQWGHGDCSRGRPTRGHGSGRRLSASMGPRRFQPWNIARRRRARRCSRPKLQWGHGVSAVEDMGASSRSVERLALQWGHGDCSRGRRDGIRSPSRPADELQWGHGISAVELTTTRRPIHDRTWLQWGHGISAVEFAERASRRWSNRTGFNGATAFQPWNCWRDSRFESWTCRTLQWGHGISAVEFAPRQV